MKEQKYTLEHWDSFYKEHQGHIEVVYGVPEGEESLLFDNIKDAENVIVHGTTGSGKSVFLHSFLKGAMKYNTPNDIKFVLVDPKHVEFFKYRDSEFLLRPIVREKDEFIEVLKDLVKELENRKQNNIAPPRIALVVDEYADLIYEKKEEIESLMSILLKEGYKYGIHVFLALQVINFEHIISKDMINLFKTRICQYSFNKEEAKYLVGKYLEELKGQGDSLVLRENTLARVQCLK